MASNLPMRPAKAEHEGESACETCENIDFVAFFTSKRKEVEFGPLGHLLACFECPLCKYLDGCIEAGEDDPALSGNAYLRLRQKDLPNGEYLRDSGIERAYRLEVWLYSNTESPVLLSTLEMCNGYPEPRYPNARMIRVPVQEQFDPALLLRWLDKTGRETVRGDMRRLPPSYKSTEDAREHFKLRVLDVSNGNVVVLRSDCRYLALSYVWGKKAGNGRRETFHPPTDRSREVAWTIDLEAQPATIRDAASLVQQLGERYLWVDALCIGQDDPPDKEAIVSNMDVIYQRAYLTIVAANGHDATAGLRRLHQHAMYPELSIDLASQTRTLSLMPTLGDYETTIQETIWNTRGWTYQEMVLSKRTVVFTEDQVFFFATGKRERECYELKEPTIRKRANGKRKPRAIPIARTTQEHLLREKQPSLPEQERAYKQAVTEYTKKRLTYEGDKLDAFSGVLNSLAQGCRTLREARALSGIMPYRDENKAYNRDFLFDWYIYGESHRIKHNKLNTRALPSWSWMGWSGEVAPSMAYRTARYSLVVMDDSNIRMDTHITLPRWPSEPQPSGLTTKEGITLHICAPLLLCKLTELTQPPLNRQLRDTQSFCSIIEASDPSQTVIGYIILETSVVQALGTEELHEFIVIRDSGSYHDDAILMLVQRCNDPKFVERVDVCESAVKAQKLIAGRDRDHFMIL